MHNLPDNSEHVSSKHLGVSNRFTALKCAVLVVTGVLKTFCIEFTVI